MIYFYSLIRVSYYSNKNKIENLAILYFIYNPNISYIFYNELKK